MPTVKDLNALFRMTSPGDRKKIGRAVRSDTEYGKIWAMLVRHGQIPERDAGLRSRTQTDAVRYLYQLVQQALQEEEKNRNVSAQVQDMLEEARFLLKTGMLTRADRSLRRALELIEQYELYLFTRPVMDMLIDINRLKLQEQELFRLFRKHERLLEAGRLLDEFFLIYHEITFYLDTRSNRHRESHTEDRLFAHPLLKKYPGKRSTIAGILYYYLNARIHLLREDHQVAFRDIRKAKDLAEQNIHLVNDKPQLYIEILRFYFSIAHANNNDPEMERFIRELTSHQKSITSGFAEQHKVMFDAVLYNMIIVYNHNQRKFDEALAGLSQLRELLPRLKAFNYIQYWSRINYNVAACYFHKQAYIPAADHYQAIINEGSLFIHPYIYAYSLMSMLLIYIEKEEYYLLLHKLRSTRWFIKQHIDPFPLDRILLDYFAQVSKYKGAWKHELRELYNIRNYINREMKHVDFNTRLSYFRVDWWLERRIEKLEATAASKK